MFEENTPEGVCSRELNAGGGVGGRVYLQGAVGQGLCRGNVRGFFAEVSVWGKAVRKSFLRGGW